MKWPAIFNEYTQSSTRTLHSPAVYWGWGCLAATAFWLTLVVCGVVLVATGH